MITQAEQKEVIRQKFDKDLLGFAMFILQEHCTLAIPDFHREIYDLITKDHKRIAIAAPRGHAKSTLISLAYVLWCALTEKKKFIIVVSDTFPQAKMFLQTIKDELEHNDFLKALYGSQRTDRWAESDIELKLGVRIMAKGEGMQFRGMKYKSFRPDLIVVDDLENDEMVESKDRRDKLERWFNSALVPSLDRDGQVVYVGTILHDDALLMKLMNPDLYGEWERKLYKAIKPDGTSLWPEHLSLEDLEQIKGDLTKRGLLDSFMAEYMNDPITDENREFKREFFKYYKDVPQNLRVSITVDPAISKKTQADYSVVYVQGTDTNNNRYCLEYIRDRMDPYELAEAIFKMVEKWEPKTVGVEKVAYQEALIYILKDEMRKRDTFFRIDPIASRSDKLVKIRGLIPMYRAGVMYHRAEHHELEEELLRFPKGRTDDIVDAQAMQLELTKRPMVHYKQATRKVDSLTGY